MSPKSNFQFSLLSGIILLGACERVAEIRPSGSDGPLAGEPPPAVTQEETPLPAEGDPEEVGAQSSTFGASIEMLEIGRAKNPVNFLDLQVTFALPQATITETEAPTESDVEIFVPRFKSFTLSTPKSDATSGDLSGQTLEFSEALLKSGEPSSGLSASLVCADADCANFEGRIVRGEESVKLTRQRTKSTDASLTVVLKKAERVEAGLFASIVDPQVEAKLLEGAKVRTQLDVLKVEGEKSFFVLTRSYRVQSPIAELPAFGKNLEAFAYRLDGVLGRSGLIRAGFRARSPGNEEVRKGIVGVQATVMLMEATSESGASPSLTIQLEADATKVMTAEHARNLRRR